MELVDQVETQIKLQTFHKAEETQVAVELIQVDLQTLLLVQDKVLVDLETVKDQDKELDKV